MLRKRSIAFFTGLLCWLASHAQVNMQAGSATFSLPIFNWSDTKSRLEALVALQYNSGSGLKVGDLPSNVGQGWNLMAGGSVTRMTVGEPDDQRANGTDDTENDPFRYPDGILYGVAYNPPYKGCPKALTRYPIYNAKNQPYKQHNFAAVDKQKDYFSFSFNGKSGMFVLNTEPGSLGSCTLLNESKVKVTYTTDENMPGIRTTINAFTIKDVDGLIYKFRVLGTTKVLESKFCDKYMTQTQSQPDFSSGGVYYQTGFENTDYVKPKVVNNWYLDEIEDALTHRTIKFHYDISETIKTTAGADVSYDSWHNYVIVTYKRSIEEKRLLTSIECADLHHKVIFNYNKNRVDVPDDKVLTSIDVTYSSYNKFNNYETRYLSRHQLNSSYFILNRYGNPTTGFEVKSARLCLRSVKKLGPDLKEDAPPYSFDYYTGSNPVEDFVPPPFCIAHDVWGFYNGLETQDFNNNGIFPFLGYADLNFDQLKGLCYLRKNWGVKINPKQNFARNGLLKQVIYPTGGTLSYEYEQNYGAYMNTSTVTMVGGVHVATTKSTDGGYSNGCANPITTHYNYVLNSGAPSLWAIEQPNNTGTMTMNYAPEQKKYVWGIRRCGGRLLGCCVWGYQYPGILSQPQNISYTWMQQFMVNAEPVLSYISAVMTIADIIIVATSTFGGPPGAVVALVVDAIASLLQIALTCFSDDTKHGTSLSYYSYDLNAVNPLPTQFKRVEVVEGSGTSGKTVYEFTSSDDYAIWELTNPNYSLKQRFAPWAYGLTKKVTQYGTDGKKVKETENLYTYTNISPNENTMFGSCKCTVKGITSQRNDDWKKYEEYSANQTASDANMAVEMYAARSGWSSKQFMYERVYKNGDDNQFVENKTEYKYNTEFQPSVIKTTASDGSVRVQTTRYSWEYADLQNAAGLLAASGINDMPVSVLEQSDDAINTYVKETVSEFTQLADGEIKVSRVLEQRTDKPGFMSPYPTMNWSLPTLDYSRYKITAAFTYDGTGVPQAAIDEGGRSAVVLYDYDQNFQVASVINAGAGDVSYTSFETANPGGWSFALGNYDVTHAVTGTSSHILTGNPGGAALNPAKPYILSFWATGSVTVSGSPNLVKSAPIVNGFTYYEYNIPAGTATVNLSGNGLIDELRLYPAAARMRTTAYDMLIGKTADCDENNRITYYEYDNLARLKAVRDENNNIVKVYEYNNVINQSGCPGVYYNPQITEYFTKSCTGDFLGTDESYTVPANRYSSTISQEDADAQAESEVLAQGQLNADAIGQCRPLYFNAYQSQDFESQSCSPGFIGGPVPYSVQARKYYSLVPGEADKMAADEIKANGQAHANDPRYANCIPNGDPDWEKIDGGRSYCHNVNGQTPAHLFEEAKDINPSSPTYNTISFQDAGESDACPFPYYNDAMSGIYYNQQCPSGEPDPYPVSIDNGAIWSYDSWQDAQDQAVQQMQYLANSYGTCHPANVYFDWYNAGPSQFVVTFSNPITGDIYSFVMPPAAWGNNSGHISIPVGNYDVNFYNSDNYRLHDFNLGCDIQITDKREEYTIYNARVDRVTMDCGITVF